MSRNPKAPSDAWIRRYLDFLGIAGEDPGLDALSRLVRAHCLAVPFENVTSLLRRRAHPVGAVPAPDPEALLAAWERRAGGGVCFEIVPMVSRLLVGLGYSTHPVVGKISLPNGHQAVLVDLDGRRHLVDLGNGAPLFEPIPLDGPAVEIHRHGLSFRFASGTHEHELLQDRLIDGVWTTYCRYDLPPASDADREQGYQHHHTPNASWVTGSLTMVRCTDDGVYALKDDVLTHHAKSDKSTQSIANAAAYRRIATDVFDMPALDIDGALAMRRLLSGPAHAGIANR